jgi:hypothetical protein
MSEIRPFLLLDYCRIYFFRLCFLRQTAMRLKVTLLIAVKNKTRDEITVRGDDFVVKFDEPNHRR